MKSRPVCTTLLLLFLLLGFESAADAQYAGATGGTVTTSGGYTIHTFTSSGTFTSSASGNVEVLVVAGGGGGGWGAGAAGGGGGGGGVLLASPLWVTAQSYTVTIGSGGAGTTDYEAPAQNGGNSVFGSLTAIGGGGGGSHGGYGGGNGVAGGSGGGAGGRGAGGGALPGGSGTSGQGYSGGTGSNGGSYSSGGGGGGAGGAGGNGSGGGSGTSGNGGNGGVGIALSLSGTSTYYGGGGGGARDQYTGTYGAGGTGGGGHGEKRDGADCVNGTVNTGGGGGGRSIGTACNGGSGVVIVRYPTPASSGGSGSTTIYFKRDHIFAGPGGGEIATVTPPPSDTTAPSAPSSLTTTTTTATSVGLSWTGSSDTGGAGLAGYKIYRQKGSGASLPVGTVNSSTTTFTDQPLEPSTSYTYKIIAFDNAQNHSSASGTVNPTTSTSSGETNAPTTPTGLTVVLTGRNSVLVRWNHSADTGGSGLKGYKVYRNGSVVSGTNPITATSFSQTGLSYRTTYGYKVEALDNNSNTSAQTSTVNVTTSGQLLYEDSFTRYDSTTLGSPWSQIGNDTLEIVHSEIFDASTDDSKWGIAVLSPGTAGYATGVALKTQSGTKGAAGLVFWVQSGAGYRAIADGTNFVLQYCADLVSNSCTTLGSQSVGGWGTQLSVTVDSSSGDIDVYSGTITYNESDSGKRSGAVGITIFDGPATGYPPNVKLDDFWVEAN